MKCIQKYGVSTTSPCADAGKIDGRREKRRRKKGIIERAEINLDRLHRPS